VDLRYVKHQCRRAKIALRSLSQKIITVLLSMQPPWTRGGRSGVLRIYFSAF